jgi:predicted phage-related endonuclease
MQVFEYSGAPQRLAVTKAKDTKGKPLKARLDYEKELMFERQFGVSFNNYISDAMQDGMDFENFARGQYNSITGRVMVECGAWHSDMFVASPDGTIGQDGLGEIKIVRDNTFTEILISGVPEKHQLQIQGQLWASGKKWCDYVAVNLNTKRVVIIRVEADKEVHDYLEEAVTEQLVFQPFSETNVHPIVGELPDNMGIPAEANNVGNGGW